ncbi:MAG: hypothetical protein MZU95_12755 [Desulfomicrobium escambiense]|nr:hypothetical protein [Desulfomicrobium escambiense]
MESANIEGIVLVKEPERFYPNGELARICWDLSAPIPPVWKRLEKKYDEVLKGKPEKVAWARDAKGKNYFYGRKRMRRKKMKALISF